MLIIKKIVCIHANITQYILFKHCMMYCVNWRKVRTHIFLTLIYELFISCCHFVLSLCCFIAYFNICHVGLRVIVFVFIFIDSTSLRLYILKKIGYKLYLYILSHSVLDSGIDRFHKLIGDQ